LEKIGNKDWYAWGADFLLADQDKDGSWNGVYGQYGADTCFALLFLRRADLAKDLSASLRGKFSTSELRGGRNPFKSDSIKKVRSPFEEGGGNDGGKDTAVSRPPARDVGKPKDKPRAAPANVDAQVAKLGAELVDAPAAKWGEALAKLRDSKGSEYTEALAHAIDQLDGEQKTKARQALADRIARLKPEFLATYMEDENSEVRRAAALACAIKDDMTHMSKLIDLLNDRERTVERASYAALKALTKQDFGPAPDATDTDKAAAVKSWRDWWKKQAEK
jgi:hypothetical protein